MFESHRHKYTPDHNIVDVVAPQQHILPVHQTVPLVRCAQPAGNFATVVQQIAALEHALVDLIRHKRAGEQAFNRMRRD
jgi:hypothetical protein